MTTAQSHDLRRSPLHDAHVAAGGRLVPFAGWELPVQYEGVMAEHRAVRTSAGLFDVSHMGQILVEGITVVDTLQHVLSNDLARVPEPGMAQYTLICNEAGGIEDDLIAYHLASDSWLLVVNASNVTHDVEWIRRHAAAGTTVTDVSANWAMLALQGPAALDVLAERVGLDLRGMRQFRFVESTWAGAQMIAATTGYTGERGCELMVSPSAAIELWNVLCADDRVSPCGLGARDTLRLEACYPLHGNDITPETSAIAAGLDWVCGWDTSFIGREDLFEQHSLGVREQLLPLSVTGRGIPRAGCNVEVGTAVVGRVTSGTMSPTLGVGIALAYIRSDIAELGTEIEINVRGTQVPATIVQRPFHRSEKSS